ncbi:MAG: radical SAM protein [Peptostreptococcaceae bacterium]|nr:radical SAM protein [Peptostreptococcaceae bacterium]
MKKKKILLIQSSPYDNQKKPIKKSRLYFVGLAMPLLAALTPADWDVEIIFETIEEIPFDTDADLIGIGSMGHAVVRSIDIAKEFKRRGKTVFMGGYMVSLMAEEAKQYCDTVIVGDGELAYPKMLEDFEAGTLKNEYKMPIREINTPLPRFELVLNKRIGDLLPVQAGRGCPKSCSFCSVYCLYKNKYIRRPIQDVVRDIKHIRSLGFRKFMLLDDNIMSDREYMMDLLDHIIPLKMQWMSQCSIEIGKDRELLEKLSRSGCTTLSFGLESILQESLDSMNKSWARVKDYPQLIRNIRSSGIDISTEMVVGADGDTLESIRRTADFIRENKIVVPRFYILTPIPGTKYYDEMKAADRIYIEDMYSYNGSQAVHIPKNMTPEELTEAYWELYNKVFEIRSILDRTILRKEFLKHPGRYLFYMSANFYYRYQIKRRITPNII